MLGLVGPYLWLQSRSDLPSRQLIGGVSLPAAATVLIGVNPLAPILAGPLGSVLAVNVGLLLLFGLATSDVWRAGGSRQPGSSGEPDGVIQR